MNVLAIDQGTSATKAVLVDDAGAPITHAVEPVSPVHVAPGGAEQDPLQLLTSVLQAGRRALAGSAEVPDAVALANQGETVLAWDPATGEPLSQAIGWQDRRSATICEALAEHSDEVARRTGLVLNPYFSAPKMAWLRQNVTDGGVVTTTDTWLVHQLTGEFVTDVATASRSLLLDLDDLVRDTELLELFDLAGSVCPDWSTATRWWERPTRSDREWKSSGW